MKLFVPVQNTSGVTGKHWIFQLVLISCLCSATGICCLTLMKRDDYIKKKKRKLLEMFCFRNKS